MVRLTLFPQSIVFCKEESLYCESPEPSRNYYIDDGYDRLIYRINIGSYALALA